ncbi:tetratricopeptide repeat protein [Dactylosporangium sp. NPDC049525]|uniref:ATP-binding protein n=1 Tax=Dactylosporangium sp. NPDC049525 TaxID=3154730 RepID=UPI00341C0FF9
MAARVGVEAGPFAELMRRHRRTAGLSQRELSTLSGLSERAIRDLERGSTVRPRGHSVRAVAAAVGLNGADLTTFLSAAQDSVTPVPPPHALDDLVGRDEVLRALLELVTVGRRRIVTVTGPGGVGKSRLAAALAGVARQRHGLDVRAVDVSALGEPDLVIEVVAEVFGCGGTSRRGHIDRVAAHLRDRRAVLVLDGFERLVGAAADVAALAGRCAGLTVLTTSQRPLLVRGEREVRLVPLRLPDAVALFEARAAAVRPGFAVTDANRAEVSAICRRLDGLPLAVELAAARMRLLTPGELVDRLDHPLAVLAGGPRDLPARHRSLRATIESSLAVVGAPAGVLFDRLAAFAGGVAFPDLEAVTTALGDDSPWLLDALAELVDTSLVRVTADGGSRYGLPDAMRELAAQRLAASADRDRVARAVAVHYLTRLRNQDTGQDIGQDTDTLRSALAWAVTHEPGLFDAATVDALFSHYERTGRLTEGQGLLAKAGAAGAPHAYVRAGQLARLRGDLTDAARLAALALTGLDPGDHSGRCMAHLTLGSVNTDRTDGRAARTHQRAALVHARRAGDVRLIGRVLNNLGTLSMELGRLADAGRLLGAALEAKRRSGAGDVDRGRTLFNLAETALDAGRHRDAEEHARAATAALRDGHPRLAAFAGTTRALALLRLGRTGAALTTVREAVALLGESGDDRRTFAVIGLRYSVVLHATGERPAAAGALRQVLAAALDSTDRDCGEAANALESHARLLAAADPAAAANLLGAAARIRRASSRPVSAATASDAVAAADLCRAALGPARFDRQCARGATMLPDSLAAAVAADR